jgi:hypothetical protein
MKSTPTRQLRHENETRSLPVLTRIQSLLHSLQTRRLFLLTLVSLFAVAGLLGVAASANKANRAAKAREAREAQAARSKSAIIKDSIAPEPRSIQQQPSAPNAASITATLTDNVAAATKVAPGGTINYTAVITNGGASSPGDDAGSVVYNGTLDPNTTLSGLVSASTIAFNDTYPQTVIGNVSINSANIPYSVVSNDYQGQNAGTPTITAFDATTTQGGQVVMTMSGVDIGKFTYNPPPGFEGTDTFTYTFTNTTGSSVGTVSIPVSGMVWFINNNAAACTTLAGGCGRLSNPFSTLAAFQALNNGTGNNPAVNDNIFVFESATTYTGGVILLGGQKFIGQDSSDSLATIAGLTVPSGSTALPAMNTGGNATTITNGAGAGIALNGTATNNTIRGLTVTNTSAAKISGNNFGTLTAGKSGSPDVILSGTGQALNLSNGSFAVTSAFTSVASTSSTAQGINLVSVGGTVAFGSTSTAASTNQGILVNTSSVNINFGNTSVTTSGGTGVNLTTNTGTATFGDLDITPNANQRALHATSNTGALTSTSGTISTTTAVAVEIAGASAVSRTPLNLQFDSVSANGSNSVANGLVLTNTSATGSPGGFRVNGVGTTVGSGGTIQNTTTRGANINTVDSLVLKNMNFTNANSTVDGGAAGACDDLILTNCNSAIYMNGVTTLATLDNLDITGTMVENGITAIGVANFKFDNSLIDGAGNEPNESGLEAQNLSGTSTVTGTEIRFSETDAFAVVNTDTSWNLTISGSTFRDSQTLFSGGGVNTNGEGGFQFRSFSVAAGTPLATINILNSSFLRLRTQGIQVFSNDDTTINLDVNGCTIDAQADIGTGLDLNADDNSTLNFNVTGNPTIQSRGGAAVNLTSFINGHVEGRVNNNPDIEVLGGAGIPVRLVAQETSTMIVEINNNTVSNINGTEDTDIDVQSRFQTARVDATITNNTVTPEVTGIAGINLISGSSTVGESNITCGDVSGNNVSNALANAVRAFRIRVSDLSNTNRLFLEGFVEAGTATQDTEATWNTRTNLPVSAGGSEVAASLTGTAVGPLAPPGGVCQAVDTPSDFRPVEATASLSTGQSVTETANGQAEKPAASIAAISGPGLSASTEAKVASLASAATGQTGNSSEVHSHHAIAKRSQLLQRSNASSQKDQPLGPLSGEPVGPVTIGTLPAGKSVTIKYAATVDTPPLARQVSHQGSVSFTNGPGSPVLTTDPGPPVVNGPTVTLIDTTATWSGATSTDWNVDTNWTQGFVPNSVSDVIIPDAGVTNEPNIITPDVNVFSLDLQSARTLTINTGRTLTVNTGLTTLAGALAGGPYTLNFVALTINRPTGITVNGPTSVTGVLTLTSGNVTTGVNVLTIGSAGSIVRTSGHIIGSLKKTSIGAAFVFTVGTVNGYTPVNLSAPSGGGDLTVTTVAAPQPTLQANNPGKQLNEYWTLTKAGTLTASLVFNYLQSDVPGTSNEANYRIHRVSGTTPTSFPQSCPTTSCVDTAANTFTISGVSNFSDWTVGEVLAPTASGGVVTGRIVDNQGLPVEGAVVRLQGTQNRKFITDANGIYRFENVETSGFYTVIPSRPNYTFSPTVRSFSQIGETTEAAFGATLSSGNFVNPLDTPEYFVRQHYIDFLGREPDEAGFNFWSDQILECGADTQCIDRRRENVSAAYFLSIEFQQTGGLVDGLYRAAYGVRPNFAEFMPDTRAVGLGVQVGQDDWEAKLAANKEAFLAAFVNRPAFHAQYDGMDNSLFVDTLIGHTGVSFTTAERDALANGLATGTTTRADVLRSIAENSRFVNAKFNDAFVMMEYFGYLRRDPDSGGFAFWLNKLNQFNGNFEQAEMVRAFIVSGEYRDRFPR